MSFVFALTVFLQDKTAEETFRKIEETYLKAKSISFEFKEVGKVKEGGIEGSIERIGTVFLKEGNRVWVYSKDIQVGNRTELEVLSDGEIMQTKCEGHTRPRWMTPKSIVDNLVVGFIRQNMSSSMAFYTSALGDDPKAADLAAIKMREFLIASDFKVGPDDKAAKTLIFTVKLGIAPAGVQHTTDLKVWYDPDSYTLLKRTMHWKAVFEGTTTEGTLTDTYDKVTFNADIPDEKFKLPAEK